MPKHKIDNNVFLDLVVKGATIQELAKYFNVASGTARSKWLTLTRSHPDLPQPKGRKENHKTADLPSRIRVYIDRHLNECADIQLALSKMPIEQSYGVLDSRMSLTLKGLTVLEKIHKITAPTQSQTTVNVASVTNILDTASQARTVIDHNHVDTE
jgi:hypothetical protein